MAVDGLRVRPAAVARIPATAYVWVCLDVTGLEVRYERRFAVRHRLLVYIQHPVLVKT